MKAAHRGMGIDELDWTIAVNLFSAALDRHRVAPRETSEFMRIIEQMKDQIVEVRARADRDHVVRRPNALAP